MGARRARRTRARARPRVASPRRRSVRRPGGVVARRVTSSSLSRSIRRDDRAEQRARVAAQVVVAQRQLVDALEQHREPVGRRRPASANGSTPGLERLVAQQPRAEAVERRDRELLVGRRRAASSMRSRSASAAALESVSARIASGGAPCSTSQAKRSTSARVLPVPGAAEDEQRAAGDASTASRWAERRARRAPP